MTALVYFVAQSLDGFIAGPEGQLDWLQAYDRADDDHGYADFIAGIDGLVMGRATFEAVRAFGLWPYGERPCWVLSRSEPSSLGALPPGVQPTHQRPSLIAARWEAMGLRRVWLVGGGQTAALFMRCGLLDELIVATVPTWLGAGRALFAAGDFAPQRYTLRHSERHPSGIVVSTLVREAAAEAPPGEDAPPAGIDIDERLGRMRRDPLTQHDTEPIDL
ncbi:MAG TPA: dihydrofolate reductase family protein [Methylibium sp.]|uniref:dihydrofolate reductase family protein n=1 Tax=Methylibium sp. TaxID=2067992 RepID=UPI002DB9D51A|nr:dihydrofolate reductase family protein [Methylibium sp.]HEU4458467.1 dihydrofolate reductase family protein [Methylibium sp.]